MYHETIRGADVVLSLYLKYLTCIVCVYSIKKLLSLNRANEVRNYLKKFIEDKKLTNENRNSKVYVEEVCEKEWGYSAILDISNVCSFQEFEKYKDYLKQLFRAKEINLENEHGKVYLDIINNQYKEIEFKFYELEPTKLLLGYDFKCEPIVVDMLKTPHIAVQGLSNTGKSICIELALNNLRGADVVLLNTFMQDFKTVKARRINGYDNILKFLLELLSELRQRTRPLFVVIDEVNELNKNKTINKAIQDLLSIGRHYNIYVVSIGQLMLKENCSYKNLFNVRVTFKMIEASTIGAFLGINVEDNKLMQREFICYSDRVQKGRTFNYRF